MPLSVTVTPQDDGQTLVVDAGATVRVELGTGWREPRLQAVGGDPGPVSRPLVARTSMRHLEPDLGFVSHFLAVSAGRAAIRAVRADGDARRFEVTVVVRPRPGTKAPGGAR